MTERIYIGAAGTDPRWTGRRVRVLLRLKSGSAQRAG
jgi:hypothetical protein